MNLNPFQKNSKDILKGQKLEIEKMLKFEEINEKSFKGKLKKFQMETHRSNAFRKPLQTYDFNNNSIMDYCLFKTDLSLEKKKNFKEEINNKKKPFFLENLKVAPVKILQNREFESDCIRKRKEGFSIKYKLTRKTKYI